MSLTPKQALFVAEYIKDFNATQAAIRAGYSERTAPTQGQRVLHYVAVQREIASALAGRIERIQVDSDWLLSRLVQEATADVADLFDSDGNLKPVQDWPDIWRQGLVSGIDVVETDVNGVTVSTMKKLRLSDRLKRLELIGKHIDINAFQERVEHTGGMNVTIVGKDADL